jgi:repressor LexA
VRLGIDIAQMFVYTWNNLGNKRSVLGYLGYCWDLQVTGLLAPALIQSKTINYGWKGHPMSNLSERQRRMLSFIVDFVGENEYPPTIREIGEHVGISSTSVVNYNLAKLEELNFISRRKEVSRGLTLNWERIQTWKAEASPDTASVPADLKPVTPLFNPAMMLRVPVLGSIAAGEPIQVEPADAANPVDWVELPESTFNRLSKRGSGRLFALRVKGDSMIDASVLDGDVVILRSQETANDGEMIAAWIEGDEETTLKYFYRDGRNIRLEPANPNPDYRPIIRPADKVRINGRVVSVLRMLDN